jgi:hypothetical protein
MSFSGNIAHANRPSPLGLPAKTPAQHVQPVVAAEFGWTPARRPVDIPVKPPDRLAPIGDRFDRSMGRNSKE